MIAWVVQADASIQRFVECTKAPHISRAKNVLAYSMLFERFSIEMNDDRRRRRRRRWSIESPLRRMAGCFPILIWIRKVWNLSFFLFDYAFLGEIFVCFFLFFLIWIGNVWNLKFLMFIFSSLSEKLNFSQFFFISPLSSKSWFFCVLLLT